MTDQKSNITSLQKKYMTPNNHQELTDQRIIKNIDQEPLKSIYFKRLIAKKITFTNVNFSFCTFEAAYLKDCTFNNCEFVGCKFVNCNMSGSTFFGCDFRYALFEKTLINHDILTCNLPSEENLQRLLLKSLRINYQQIGDIDGANKAISLELEATQIHLKKSWKSRDKYYRNKYQGIKRFNMLIKWISFSLLDLIWGNGESVIKLCRAILFIALLIATIDYYIFSATPSFINSLKLAPSILFSTIRPEHYPNYYITAIFITRLTMFAFFISIVIKRFNRR